MPLTPYIYALAFLPIAAIALVLILDYVLHATGRTTISDAVRAATGKYPVIAYLYIAFWAYLGGALTIHWFLYRY